MYGDLKLNVQICTKDVLTIVAGHMDSSVGSVFSSD